MRDARPKVLGLVAVSIWLTIRQFFQGRAPLSPCTIALKDMDFAADGSRVEAQEVTSVGLRGRLFRKYAVVLAGLVSVALIANGLLDIWFSYREQRALLVRIQAEQAATAAARISHFVTEIEGQMGWTTQMAWNPWDIQQRRLPGLRLSGRGPPDNALFV